MWASCVEREEEQDIDKEEELEEECEEVDLPTELSHTSSLQDIEF